MQAWFYYSGGEAKQQAHPNVYQQLVAKAENMGENNESLDVIERGKCCICVFLCSM